MLFYRKTIKLYETIYDTEAIPKLNIKSEAYFIANMQETLAECRKFSQTYVVQG